MDEPRGRGRGCAWGAARGVCCRCEGPGLQLHPQPPPAAALLYAAGPGPGPGSLADWPPPPPRRGGGARRAQPGPPRLPQVGGGGEAWTNPRERGQPRRGGRRVPGMTSSAPDARGWESPGGPVTSLSQLLFTRPAFYSCRLL